MMRKSPETDKEETIECCEPITEVGDETGGSHNSLTHQT